MIKEDESVAFKLQITWDKNKYGDASTVHFIFIVIPTAIMRYSVVYILWYVTNICNMSFIILFTTIMARIFYIYEVRIWCMCNNVTVLLYTSTQSWIISILRQHNNRIMSDINHQYSICMYSEEYQCGSIRPA